MKKMKINNHRELVGTSLQDIRVQRGLTIEEVAEKTGLTSATIAKVEQGKFNYQIDTIGAICEALGVTIEIKFE